MAVMVWFGRAWGPYEARAVAEVTESVAEALVEAGVATLVDLAPPVAVEEPEPREEPKPVKGRARRKDAR